ncbi:DUF6414 family protein [Psychrobacter sanguinis]|uniref:DUF6414 family protein n=1 Tax=Psychrobacter sanguinis TaxID=861445 RepID=UPI0028ABE594|nr:hypothetical protein [Psychrobacter sanguinis]
MIKNIVYLDEDKMYSLSSQLFEGITEYVLNEKNLEKSETEEQKGYLSSGKIVGDILKNSERNTEKRFLNDYSYTLFEKKLIEENKVIVATNKSHNLSDTISTKSFIKITANATFNDMNSLIETLNNFNKMGKALTHVTSYPDIERIKNELIRVQKSEDERSKISDLNVQLKKISNVDKQAIESGMQLDKDYLDNLSFLLEFGFKNQLEVQLNLPNNIVSANLNRNFLRESEDILIRKYSRQTEVEFTLFGIVTQYKKEQIDPPEVESNAKTIKEAIMNMVAHVTNLESAFTGRLSNEIIIDPIALYTEL